MFSSDISQESLQMDFFMSEKALNYTTNYKN